MSSWSPNTFYKLGDLVVFQNISYKCQIAHTSIVSWEPNIVPALWLKQTSPVTQPVVTQPQQPIVVSPPVPPPQPPKPQQPIVVPPLISQVPTPIVVSSLPANTQTVNMNQNPVNSHIFHVNIDIDFI